MFQCAPNLSEGRDPALTEQVRATLGDLPGVALGDLSTDPDHNRMVVSLLGSAAGLREAVLRLFALAETALDLSRHQGVHPRIGAVDVVPFVPLAGTSAEAADQLAVAVAEEVATRFNLPVLLYELSARSDEWRCLPDIRRGGLEGLAERLAVTPPDFGPSQLHPRLGATVIGARKPLVAFNIWLDSNDLVLARDIARSVRFSSGGLEGVRALGLPLHSQDRVQVSINLTNPESVDLLEIFQRVQELARIRGVEVHSSELIGMAPASSFVKVARHALKAPNLQPGQLLEWNCLHQARRWDFL